MTDNPELASTTFRGGRVFDGARFLDGPHDVVVRGRHIHAVTPSTSVPPEGNVVDCAGKTILPGFIDNHVHLLSTKANPVHNALDPFSLAYYRSVDNARRIVMSGVTSARDLAGADAGLKMALETGVIVGPRLAIAIGGMSITGGHGDNWLRSGVSLHVVNSDSPGKPSAIADGVEEVRKVARQMFRAGADVIKICATGGVMSTNDHPDHSQFSEEEIRVIVDEASAHGSYVAAHAIGAKGIMNALRAGVRSIEHAIFVDDAAIELMLANDAYMVPTLIAPREVLRQGTLPENMMAKARAVVDLHVANFRTAVDAGVRIAMGSDAGIGEHGHGLEELAAMAEGGMSLEAILAAATSVGAELLPAEMNVGTLASGYLADIVQLDFELTSTARLTGIGEHIAGVWQDGRRVVAV